MDKYATTELLSQVVVNAAYGRAMLSAHALELKLSTLLVIRFGEAEPDECCRGTKAAQIKRLPLGRLIELFIAEFTVDNELQEELDNMLYFRNELVHRISDTVLGKALEPGWRQRVVAELLEIDSYFRETNARLEHYVDEWLDANGLTKQQLVSIGMAVFKGLASD